MKFIISITDADKPTKTRSGEEKYSSLTSSGLDPSTTANVKVKYGSYDVKIAISNGSVTTLTSPIALENAQYDVDTDAATMSKSNSTAPAQGGGSSAAPGATGSPPGDPSADAIFDLLNAKLKSVIAELDTLGEGDFALGQLWNKEMQDYATAFGLKQDVIFSNDAFPDRSATVTSRAAGNMKIIKAMQGAFAAGTKLGKALELVGKAPIDGLPQHVQKMVDDTPAFKEFIYAGHEGKLTSGSDNARMYDDLVGLFGIFGIGGKLDKIYAKIKEEKTAPAKAEPAKSDAEPERGSDDEGDEQKSEPTAPEAERSSDPPRKEKGAEKSGEPAALEAEKKEPPGTAFYIKIINADVSENAIITISTTDVESTNQLPPYRVSGSSFDGRIPVPINDRTRAWFKAAAESGQPISVSVEAKPNTGGERVTKKQQVFVRYPFPSARAEIPALEFIIGRAKGLVVYDGLEANFGRGGAKNFTNGSGVVSEVFWTPGDGVSEAKVPVRVSAVGKEYTFQFPDRPLIVPIRITNAKKVDMLKESSIGTLREASTVPHWIFIKPSAGEGASSRDAGGAEPAGGVAVNVAVSQVQISTPKKWIVLPNTRGNWDRGSFDVVITRGAGADLNGMPTGAKRIMSINDLKAAGADIDEVENAIYEALFNSSEAWSRLGGPYCWASDASVSGPRGVTRREITQNVGMSG